MIFDTRYKIQEIEIYKVSLSLPKFELEIGG